MLQRRRRLNQSGGSIRNHDPELIWSPPPLSRSTTRGRVLMICLSLEKVLESVLELSASASKKIAAGVLRTRPHMSR